MVPRTTCAGTSTFHGFSELVGSLDLFPAGPPEVPRAELPAVGVRERGARPRVAAGRDVARRGSRPDARARALRRLEAPAQATIRRAAADDPRSPSRPRGSSSIPRASGRRRSSPSSPSSTRSTCSTSRGRIAGRPSTSRPIRGSTGSSPRRSRGRARRPRSRRPRDRRGAGASSRAHQLGCGHPLGGRDRGAAVRAALAQHQAVEVRELLGALRHVRLLPRPRHHDVRRRAVRALRGARDRSRRSRRSSIRTGRTTSLRWATTARPWSPGRRPARCRRMAQPWAFGERHVARADSAYRVSRSGCTYIAESTQASGSASGANERAGARGSAAPVSRRRCSPWGRHRARRVVLHPRRRTPP